MILHKHFNILMGMKRCVGSFGLAVILAAGLLAGNAGPVKADGFFLGIGGNGIFGGVRVREGVGRRYHCHGRYCHRHRNRGYHNHNRGVRVYPPHTAPRYGTRRAYQAHVNWCLNRYRSYDPRSDTFQPYRGPRRRCNSPYDGY